MPEDTETDKSNSQVMPKPNMIRGFALIFALYAAGCFGQSAVVAAKPNILIIVGNGMGYADIGVHACKDIPTPAIDALAASGVRFTSGYVSGPYCSPTRAVETDRDI
jgi:hypothetical protein